jgi:hypothetical protein
MVLEPDWRQAVMWNAAGYLRTSARDARPPAGTAASTKTGLLLVPDIWRTQVDTARFSPRPDVSPRLPTMASPVPAGDQDTAGVSSGV